MFKITKSDEAQLPTFNNNKDDKAAICDFPTYADDANIEFNNYNESPLKHKTYNYINT